MSASGVAADPTGHLTQRVDEDGLVGFVESREHGGGVAAVPTEDRFKDLATLVGEHHTQGAPIGVIGSGVEHTS